MGHFLRRHRGGIAGLLLLPSRHWQAIESDLTDVGWSLADIPGRLSWRGLLNWLRFRPATSMSYRVTHPHTEVPFTPAENRLADVADLLNLLLFAFIQANSRRSIGQPPAPLPRPGVAAKGQPGDRQIGSGAGRPLDEMQTMLVELDRRDRAGLRVLRATEVVT